MNDTLKMAEPELVYCEPIDLPSNDEPPPPPLPMRMENISPSSVKINSLQRMPSPLSTAVITKCCKIEHQNVSRKRMFLLTITIIFLSISSLVFMTLYFSTMAKGKPSDSQHSGNKDINKKRSNTYLFFIVSSTIYISIQIEI